MTRSELKDLYGYDEGRKCAAVACCANCNRTPTQADLIEYPAANGTWPLLCEDCAAEERRSEERADALAKEAA